MLVLLYFFIGFCLSLYLCDGISNAKSDNILITVLYPVIIMSIVLQALDWRK